MELRCELHNEFQFILRDAKTGTVKQTLKAYNVVTDYYFNRLRNSSNLINYLHVGTGTGVPAITDRSMFTWLTCKTFSSQRNVYLNEPGQEYMNAYRRVTLFNENEANGDITEVGLSEDNRDGYLWTHSLIVDSEGHSTAVHKTETDTLEITSIVYSKIISSGFLQPVRQCGEPDSNNFWVPRQANPEFIDSGCTYSKGVLSTLGANYGFNQAPYLQFFLTREPVLLGVDTQTMNSGSGTRTTTQDGKVRYTTPRLLSSNLNGRQTYQIKSAVLSIGTVLGSGGLAYFNFPNHTLYPPEKLTFEKVGDGTTVDFNLGVPLLMEDSALVSVYLDGVLQDPSSYDWYGKDYSLWQAWPTAETEYLDSWKLTTDSIGYNTSAYFPTLPTSGGYVSIYMYVPGSDMSSDPTGTQYIVYDFKEPTVISAICSKYRYSPSTSNRGLLQYSNDKETWVTAIEYRQALGVQSFSPITARYWRVTNEEGYHWARGDCPVFPGSAGTYSNDISECILAFGDPKPQIHFHTAPAVDSVIKIEAYTEYPIKNDKWMLDQVVIDMDFVRGSE